MTCTLVATRRLVQKICLTRTLYKGPDLLDSCGKLLNCPLSPILFAMNSSHMPVELLHHILTDVLADCLHTVCTSDEETIWELNALHTLCCVCFTFREIAEQVAYKAFALDGDER